MQIVPQHMSCQDLKNKREKRRRQKEEQPGEEESLNISNSVVWLPADTRCNLNIIITSELWLAMWLQCNTLVTP